MSAPAIPGVERGPAPISLRARTGRAPLGAILAACALAATTLVSVLHLDRLPFSLCVFKALTGWPCMTCGTTRALGRLAHFDVAGALAMNPLVAAGALVRPTSRSCRPAAPFRCSSRRPGRAWRASPPSRRCSSTGPGSSRWDAEASSSLAPRKLLTPAGRPRLYSAG